MSDVGKCVQPFISDGIFRKAKKELVDLVTVENCHRVAQQMEFKIFNDKPNIWGIRVPKGDNFNDLFIVFWKEHIITSQEPQWRSIITYGTTEPAPGYLKNLVAAGKKNPNGIFVLQANKQYVDCWVWGSHKGKYEALDQYWQFKFVGYRKKADSEQYYEGVLYTDASGIEFHTTKRGYLTNKIVGWSEGCQVIFDANIYFDKILPALAPYKGHKYSYTIVSDALFMSL